MNAATHEAKLQQMMDHHDIRQILIRYCRGIDRLDKNLISSVYHANAKDNHGSFQGDGAAFTIHVVDALREHTEATTHTLGQSSISVTGNSASSETYVLASHRREADGQTYIDVFAGRYVDKLERQEGRWGIVERVVVWDWSKTDKVESSYYSPDDFTNGVRSADDISYQFGVDGLD